MILYLLALLTHSVAVSEQRQPQFPQNYRIGVPRFKTFEKANNEVYLGDKVKLSCLALASTPPTAQWFRNGKALENHNLKNERFKENKNDMSLEIKRVEVSDQGLWSCKVSNHIGSIGRNFTIEIVDFCDYFLSHRMNQSTIPLECICLWSKQNVRRQDLDFSVATPEACVKYRESITRQEKRPLTRIPCYEPPCDEFGKPLPKPKLHAVEHVHGVPPFDKLDTEEEQLEDEHVLETSPQHSPKDISNTYKNYFSNFSSSSVEIEQAVLTPQPEVKPYFKDNEDTVRSLASPAGRTIRLNCKASGFPEPRIAWHKNSALILPDSPRVSGSEYKIRKHTLEMEDTTEADSGIYTCEVWSALGSISRDFNVTIVNRMRAPPLIVPNILQNQTVYVNGTATFHCKVVSDLIPHIMWVRINKTEDGSYYYYNETARENMFMYTEMDQTPHARIIKNKDESTLIIENVALSDQGMYACITGNSLGTTVANATLFVNDFHGMEIPTGQIEPEYSLGSILLLIAVIMLLTLILGLCVSYFTCIPYVRKRQEDRDALLTKRKKIVVTHKKQREDEGWSDLQSAYKIQVVEQNSVGKKGRRPRLSSDLTLLDDYEVDTDPQWEVERSRLEMLEEIGSGAFGEVCKARLHPPLHQPGGEVIPVAVKKVKACATEKDLLALVGEMEMFKTIGEHENVLRLLGCCTGVGPLYVILELCEHGNLRDFLRIHRPREQKPVITNSHLDYLEPKTVDTSKVLIENLTQRHLVDFAMQVAKGMRYMAAKKIVHRDLAARNVLVANNFVMKISDFGLSRDVHYRDYYRKKDKGRIPFKWMAIESLDENQISTIESDVWSFGILLWEIMTLGGIPYPTIAMENLYKCLKSGYRMEIPHQCPEEVYNMMLACWQEKREARPTFDIIVDFFEWMLAQDASADEDEESPSGGSSDDLGDAEGNTSPSEGEESSSKKKMRPLSAPVNLPSAPQHSMCDEDEELPPQQAPLPENSASISFRKGDGGYSVPHKLFRQHTDPTSNNDSCDYSELRHVSSIVAPSVDSAIGSPAWHLMDSSYSIPIQDQSRPNHFYVNIGSLESSPGSTKFIFPPAQPRTSNASMNDNHHNFQFMNGKTNQAYMPSPNPVNDKNDLNRRHSDESNASSGRGRSTESSADHLAGYSDYCRITDAHLPLRRMGDKKKSDLDSRKQALNNLAQKLSDNI